MLKIFLFIILSPLLFAQNIKSVDSIVELNRPFMLKSSEDIFDNNLFYTHKPLLKCQPELNAIYKIKSANRLKVLPRESLQSGKEYSCRYKEESFSFYTVGLKVNEALYFEHEKIIRLSFNDTIDPKSIKKGIVLKKVDRLATTTLQYKIIDKNEKSLVLKIVEKVGRSRVVLSIDKNLKTKHGGSLDESYSKTFNIEDREVKLDRDREKLILKDKPRMVALENGKFALRIFVEDDLEGKSDRFVEIEGIENLQVGDEHYMDYYMREEFGVKNSYGYHDVTSDEFEANTFYNITLKKGLKIYSHELKEDISYHLKTPNRAKTIFLDKDKHYISSQGEVAFSSVNVEDATLVVERILDDNLRYFINFDDAQKNHVGEYTKEIFTKKLNLNAKFNQIVGQKFKLSDLSDKELTTGVYRVSLHYTDDDEKEKVRSKVLFVSDLGLSINLSKNQAFVSVLSLSLAKPVEGAEVLIYGRNNALLATATTNAEGIATIEHKGLLSQKPKSLVVKTKNDKNFLLLNKSISSPSPTDILKEKERFNAHIYFQSNILRPASKLHALITVKDRDFISASNLPVKIMLRDPKSKTIHQKVYHTGEYGLIDFDYQLSKSDKLGDYHLLVKIGNNLLAEKKLKVEAFMPPKIENHITTSKKLYHVGELIEANITSAYLFGTPSANLQGKVTLNARPISYHNETYKDYTFSNDYLKQENVTLYLEHSEDIVLDNQGRFEIALETNVKQRVPSILEAMIGVTIMDDAQPVSSYKKVKLYPYRSMVGLKLDHDSFEKGQKLKGEAILIDPITGKTINKTLQATIKKIDWHYSYSEGHYNWEKETKVVDSFNIQANKPFSHDINDNGDYYIEVSDHLSGHSASLSFDVWWWSYSNISPKNDLKSVEINFEDRLYKKGDTLDVTLKSPILEGKALLTLEGERVERYKLVDIHKGVAKASLKIEQEIKRGLYVHATVYRASDTPSNLIPYRAMGYKFVKPNRNEHKIKIEMNLPKISESKRTLKLDIKTDKPSKVLVSVVDRGILQLVNQKKPELFKHFNKAQEKSLAYYDLYDEVLAYIVEGQLVDFGAGDMLETRKKHLAPDFGEKRIKPFMLWSGIVDAKDGVASVDLKIPEFNGRASVVVVAINQDSLGVIDRDIKIKDDIMLKPSYPRFALRGDKIEVPLRVFNTTKEAKVVKLSSVNSDNLTILLKDKTLNIPANSSKKTTLRVSPISEGEGNISIIANFDNKEVTKSVELPILSPYALSTKTFKGISSSKVNFTAPKDYEDATLYITLSNNLIGALRDDLNYLVGYPYGCAEQTSSKLSAMHYAKPFLSKDQLLKDSKHYILEGIKKLDSMQNYYGEFSYWQGGDYIHPYASLYASQTLLELKRDGADVKNGLEKKIITMLNSVASANGRYDGKYSDFHRVYAGFILAEHKKLSSSVANMLYEKELYKKSRLATYYMASILKMQGEKSKADELYKTKSVALSSYTKDTYGNRYGNFGSNVRDMLLHFMIKSRYFDKNAQDLELVQKEFSHLYSTQTKAIALKAVSSYLGKPTDSKIDVEIEVNGKKSHYTKPKFISFKKLKAPNLSITPTKNAVAYSVEFSKNLEKSLSNRLTTDTLSIKREFINEAGDAVELDNLAQGERLYSKVTIQNYGKIDNVVISQRIPACFTIVNNNIKEIEARFKDKDIEVEHKEIRDDRTLHFVNLVKRESYDSSTKKYINKAVQGTLYTPLIASSIGECKLPAIITEAMYDTRVSAYAKEAKEVVIKALKDKRAKKTVVTPIKVDFKLRAKALVEELYRLEMSSQKAREFLKFYHYPLKRYFRETNVTKDRILEDRINYFKEFKKRTYSNIKTDIVSSDDNATVIEISFDYKIDNGKKAKTGSSHHRLKLIEVNGKAKISEISLVKKSLSSRAVSLVKKLYNREMNSNNENDFIEFFHYPLTDYFRHKDATKEIVLEDKKSYFKSWKTRKYSNIKVIVLSKNDKEVKIKISFDYTISNGKKTVNGKSKHLLTVIEFKDKALVSSVGVGK